MWKHLNEEGIPAVEKMTSVMKSLRADSQDDLLAESLTDQIDIGVITMREDDEYEALLSRFSSWRHVRGSGSDYSYSRVQPRRGAELRIVVARTPEQGPGGREHLLLFVAPERLTAFEEVLAALPRAEAGRPVLSAQLPREALGNIRGVGGLAAAGQAASSAGSQLESLLPLATRGETAKGLWARQVTFQNPDE